MSAAGTRQAPGPIENRRARFAGYRSRALVRAGRGATVLCLHGWSESADGFRPLMQALADTDGPVVALDLPGHGEGPALAPPPQRVLAQMADFAGAAIDRYADGGAVILVGHSLGGRSALAAAVRRQAQVAAVIALAPAPLRLQPWLRAVAAEHRLIPRAARLLGWLPDEFARRQYVRGHRRTFHAPDEIDPAVFQRAGQFYDARRLVACAEGLHRLAGELGEALDLSGLRIPVDLLHGCQDRLVALATSRAYQAQLPQARFIEVADCGHNLALEKPQVVAECVRRQQAALRKQA